MSWYPFQWFLVLLGTLSDFLGLKMLVLLLVASFGEPPYRAAASAPDFFPKCCPVGEILISHISYYCSKASNITSLVEPGQEVVSGFPTCGNEANIKHLPTPAAVNRLLDNYAESGSDDRSLCVDYIQFGLEENSTRHRVAKQCPEIEENDKPDKPQEKHDCEWKYQYLDTILLSISCLALALALCWGGLANNVRSLVHGRCLMCLLSALLFAYFSILINRFSRKQLNDTHSGGFCSFLGESSACNRTDCAR